MTVFTERFAMNDRTPTQPICVSIAAVERDTGLLKDTLRVWERRYGFPAPGRDGFGERAYPIDQIEKLRLIRRLLDAGQRPGRVVHLGLSELQRLSDALRPMPLLHPDPTNVDLYLSLVKAHDIDGFKRELSQANLRMGLAAFVTDLIAPLNTAVGEAWMGGQLAVFEEHLYTEGINVVLRAALASVPSTSPSGRPRVLLSTFPQEAHGIGLLMAEIMFALEGGKCVSLGVQTPIHELVQAVAAHQSDIVALSFTASLNPNDVLAGLKELRAQLPAGLEIWAGGACPIIHRRPIDGVLSLDSLKAIDEHLGRWRQSHLS